MAPGKTREAQPLTEATTAERGTESPRAGDPSRDFSPLEVTERSKCLARVCCPGRYHMEPAPRSRVTRVSALGDERAAVAIPVLKGGRQSCPKGGGLPRMSLWCKGGHTAALLQRQRHRHDIAGHWSTGRCSERTEAGSDEDQGRPTAVDLVHRPWTKGAPPSWTGACEEP